MLYLEEVLEASKYGKKGTDNQQWLILMILGVGCQIFDSFKGSIIILVFKKIANKCFKMKKLLQEDFSVKTYLDFARNIDPLKLLIKTFGAFKTFEVFSAKH